MGKDSWQVGLVGYSFMEDDWRLNDTTGRLANTTGRLAESQWRRIS
jgi:hypothetical protein